MCLANTADFFHDRGISARLVAQKSPVGASTSINDVINGCCAQDLACLNVSMFYYKPLLRGYPNHAGNLTPSIAAVCPPLNRTSEL